MKLDEHLERLSAMADDEGMTWDLSPNDKAAIAAVLESREHWKALADSARDFIAEGGLCSRMVGARELVNEIDAKLNEESGEFADDDA